MELMFGKDRAMTRKTVVMAAFCLVLAGCAAFALQPRQDPSFYSHVYKSYDLTFFWNIKMESSTFYLSGMTRNTYIYPLTGLEMTVTLLDGQKKELGEATYFFIPPQINVDESEPFDLAINLREGGKPETLKFFYRYRVSEKGGYGNIPYYYSFEVNLDSTTPSGSGKSY